LEEKVSQYSLFRYGFRFWSDDGDKEDAHGFGDVWRMDDSNQNGGHTCTKTATENPNNPKLKGSMISTRSTNNEDEGWLCELCNTNFTKQMISC
jgi:hypothetical protein